MGEDKLHSVGKVLEFKYKKRDIEREKNLRE